MKNLKTVLSILLLSSVLCSCKKDIDITLVKSVRLQDAHFAAIQVGEAFEVTVLNDENTFVETECSAYLNDYIISKVEGAKLLLSVDKVGNLPAGTEYRAIVHTPDLHSVAMADASTMTIKSNFDGFTSAVLSGNSSCSGGVFSGDEANVTLSGTSQLINFTFDGQHFEAKLGDASRFVGNVNAINNFDVELDAASTFVNYGGATQNAIINLTDGSLLNMAQTEIQRVEVDFSGASSATVKATETISGRLAEASSLYYYGTPVFAPDFVCDTTSFVVRL